ncbi:MAG: T9SS type A sorting domain-containing protein [Parabacteroides sp.]|nr:T9SS type A sorting domain-containing protein [Parabacteroides sp.]
MLTGTTARSPSPPPEGFTICLTDNTNEAVETGEAESTTQLTFTEEGLHTVAYTLTRREQDNEKTATFGIDLNAPAVSVQNNYLAFTLTATDGEGSGIASAQIDGMGVTLTDGEYKGNASAGTHTYLVTDKVGRKTEGSFTLTAYTPPSYVPSYYDIYLEPNDSVRLSTTGTTVEEGYSFTLTAEVAEGYDPEALVVEYRKGRSGSWQTLKAESSGKYRIRSVYSDIYIRASVRPLGDPTALETVGDGKSHIRTGGGIVYIETPVPQRVTVFTLDGRLIRHESLPAGDSRLYGLPAGLYVIRLQDGTTVKGLVRR